MRNSQILAHLLAILTLFITIHAKAALVGRDLDGVLTTAEAYYDDEANLTWLADASYAKTSGYDADGRMSWSQANDWATNLDIDGTGGWRLANSDGCNTYHSYPSLCIDSEMGNLFYNVLGGSQGSSIYSIHNANLELFSNVQQDSYWTSTEYTPNIEYAWHFNYIYGQGYNDKDYGLYTWAVHDGDVGEQVVPIPSAVWLFGSGLIGLIGLARRKANA